MVKSVVFLVLLLGVAANASSESAAAQAHDAALVKEALGDLTLAHVPVNVEDDLEVPSAASTEKPDANDISTEDVESQLAHLDMKQLTQHESEDLSSHLDALLEAPVDETVNQHHTDAALEFRAHMNNLIEEAKENAMNTELSEISQCRGVIKYLRKRDNDEHKRQNKEIMLIELVREQLHKLNKIGHKGVTTDLMTKIVAQLDVGRDYAVVNGDNGIFVMLKKLEDRMVEQLKEMRAETTKKNTWCVNSCKARYDFLKKQQQSHHVALTQARELLHKLMKDFANLRGDYEAKVADYQRAVHEHDINQQVWTAEIALLSVLKMKAAKYIKLHITDCKDPKDDCNKALAAKAQQMLTDISMFEGVRADTFEDVAVTLTKRRHENMEEIMEMFETIEKKVVGQRETSAKAIRDMEAHLVQLRKKLAQLEEAKKVQNTVVTKALLLYKQTSEALADVREWCGGFIDEA